MHYTELTNIAVRRDAARPIPPRGDVRSRGSRLAGLRLALLRRRRRDAAPAGACAR